MATKRPNRLRWGAGHDQTWMQKPPFIGAYKQGEKDALEGHDNRARKHYNNRGWGHQFIKAYDAGYVAQRKRQAPQRPLDLEE